MTNQDKVEIFVGAVAKQARKEYNLSATYVASFCGITSDKLLAIEDDRSAPSEEVVSKLMTIYGYERRDFFTEPLSQVDTFLAWQKEVSKYILSKKGEDTPVRIIHVMLEVMDDHILAKAFEEIKAFQRSSILPDGVMKNVHQFAESHLSEELDIRKTEELFLLEMASRFVKRVH